MCKARRREKAKVRNKELAVQQIRLRCDTQDVCFPLSKVSSDSEERPQI